MAYESRSPASTTTIHADDSPPQSPSTTNAPPASFTMRRAATLGQPPQLRRRLNSNDSPDSPHPHNFRRRSSTYSDYLETSADELLNPSKASSDEEQKLPFVYIPLVLALLPAVAGVFFENGSAFFTDLILLVLAAVFLRWSVTQPWHWYHSAQQIRAIQDELISDPVFETDSDSDVPSFPAASVLENVPEEQEKEGETPQRTKRPPIPRNTGWEARQAAAIKELHIYEMMALAWCFIFPMLGAYLLHAIRGQLSRPSEGLVSDYNLTIFLCAAEIRPISHLMRMLQQRTLHVQAIVAQNPHARKDVVDAQLQALRVRLDELESRELTKDSASSATPPEVPQKLVESAVGREFRRSIQPELEALSRAMRRYEKKLILLAGQTDNKIEYIEYQLSDAIALAAIATRNNDSQRGLVGRLTESVAAVVMLPFQAVAAMVTFPFRTASTLFRWNGQPTTEKMQRLSRNGKSPAQARAGQDRMPSRLSRR